MTASAHATQKSFLDSLVSSHNLFHSFCIKPQFRFSTQQDGEEVVLVLRAHPITQIPWIINTVFFLIVLIIIAMFLPLLFTSFQILFVGVFGVVFIISYAFFNILLWFFNVGIVTTERVIDIDFQGVIYREITAANLTNIQDVTEKSGGFLESFVDFGEVYIQTAGTLQNVEFRGIPKPSQVIKIINQLTNP